MRGALAFPRCARPLDWRTLLVIQLDPPLELDTPKGRGLCWFFHDYGIEQDNYYTVAIHETGELWTFGNREVRATKNITLGRPRNAVKERNQQENYQFEHPRDGSERPSAETSRGCCA